MNSHTKRIATSAGLAGAITLVGAVATMAAQATITVIVDQAANETKQIDCADFSKGGSAAFCDATSSFVVMTTVNQAYPKKLRVTCEANRGLTRTALIGQDGAWKVKQCKTATFKDPDDLVLCSMVNLNADGTYKNCVVNR